MPLQNLRVAQSATDDRGDGCWLSYEGLTITGRTKIAGKHQPTSFSGDPREALSKKNSRSRAMTTVLT
ncbi:hypothetical protein [Bradyrhizobium zhanjiangense]|uniref:hypothetical protein n=1 Tax=Bradyrhizobium zhanjiangense TaxID=1325107 RepID=UPI0010093C1D|nr:hypothetical protein [Bradyrhizobium zhanjiangense]